MDCSHPRSLSSVFLQPAPEAVTASPKERARRHLQSKVYPCTNANAHRNVQTDWPGLRKVNMIKSGDRLYCIIGEWADMTDLVAARPKMIATLDSFRDTLEDLGDSLGVTDPVSGPVVLGLK